MNVYPGRHKGGSARQAHDPQARFDIGALEQRVYGLERGIETLGNTTAAQFAELRKDTANQISAVSQQIANLTTTLNERSRPQWMLMVSFAGFILAFMTAIGTLAYMPIQKTTATLESEIRMMREHMVTRSEQANLMTTLLGRIENVEVGLVPRPELDVRWKAIGQRFDDHQRQLDEMAHPRKP